MDQSSYMPVTPVLPGDMAVKQDEAGRDVRAQLDAVIGDR